MLKTFTVPPDKAALYIFRNENFAGAVLLAVSVNGKTLGQTAPKTYFRLALRPGKYTIESYGENVSSLNLTVAGGKNYYVWQEIKMGLWSAGTRLQQVDENTGRAGVSESKLIATSITGEDLAPFGEHLESPRPSAPPDQSIPEKLRELQKLRNDGIITEEEFQRKKRQLLENY